MTELDLDSADGHRGRHDEAAAVVTDGTRPDLENPVTPRPDIDPTPGSPRLSVAAEPNYATTDIDPTPGSPRPLVAAEPNYATTDIDPSAERVWPDDVQGPAGSVADYPVVDASRPATTSARGR